MTEVGFELAPISLKPCALLTHLYTAMIVEIEIIIDIHYATEFHFIILTISFFLT